MTLFYEDHSSNGMNERMLLIGAMALLALIAWFAVCAMTGESTVDQERRGRGLAAAQAMAPTQTPIPNPKP